MTIKKEVKSMMEKTITMVQEQPCIPNKVYTLVKCMDEIYWFKFLNTAVFRCGTCGAKKIIKNFHASNIQGKKLCCDEFDILEVRIFIISERKFKRYLRNKYQK